MIEWSETHELARQSFRRFIEDEIVPKIDDLEHGDLPPYDLIRKMQQTFGMDELARERFHARIAKEKAIEAGESVAETETKEQSIDTVGMDTLLTIELCRHCPGIVTAMGVSQGLAGGAIMSKGTIEQKQRWGLDLLTMDKIGSWAITEPGSGSDAFGGMKASAKKVGDNEYLLNGNKTFITNGPYADTIIFICKLVEEGVADRDRQILTFILDSGMEGLTQSKPFRKMGIHSSPTGEIFLDDVRVSTDRLVGYGKKAAPKSGGGKAGAKGTFTAERTGVAAMALGIIERCLELSVAYAKERVQWDKPIGEYQLIQLKLAKMEVARTNIQNLVFRSIECRAKGKEMTFAEASAMKLYSAQSASEVAAEAVQIFGGNGYMTEYRVEQMYRDAKILQIYAGTDEMQIRAIARDLLSRN